MRLTRKHVELIHEAFQDIAAEEVELAIGNDGKLRVSAVETIERLRPIALGKLATRTKSSART